jgi:phosphomannomutase
MEELKALVEKGEFPNAPEGNLVETDITADYLDRLFELIPAETIKGLKVVVDAGNGMGGVILPAIFKELDVKVHPLYWEPDGTFPNHEANPLKTETLEDLQAKVKEVGADIGIALDGDSDRIGLVDEKGEVIRADQIIALLAHLLLPGKIGRAATYNVSCGNVAREEIEAAGGRPVMTPTGHALIKPVVRREGAVFGGELSGHFYFEEFGAAENTDYVMLLFLQMLSRERRPLSEIASRVRRYAHSGEVNFMVLEPKAKLAAIKGKFAPEAKAVIEIDGLRLDFDDWWCSIRASNTEPLLRLNLEAMTPEMMEEKKRELVALIEA